MITVYDAKGLLVEEFKKLEHGNMMHTVDVKQVGGARQRKLAPDNYGVSKMHPDATEALNDMIQQYKKGKRRYCIRGRSSRKQ